MASERIRTVLHAITTLEPAGAQTLLLRTLPHLDPSRFRVLLVFFHRQPVPAAAGSVEIVDLSRGGRFDPAAPLRLLRLLRAERVDLVHTHLVHAGVLGKLAAHAAGVRAVVATRHYAQHEKEGTPLYRLEDALNARLPRIVAVSEAVREHLVRRRLARPERIVVIPNGIDCARFQPATTVPLGDDPPAAGTVLPAGAARLASGTRDGSVRIGAVGRLTVQKDYPLLLEAFRRLGERWPDLHLEIVGEGPERAALGELAEALGISKRVTFLGTFPPDDMPAAFARWQVFAMTSAWESFGIAAVEAMAAGLPVVATSVEGLREVITSGVDGVLVPPGDPAALAAALDSLLADAAFRERLGTAAVTTARARYSVERVARDLAGLYDELVPPERA